MAKIRQDDSKAALARQRAELRRSPHGKIHIGDDTGSNAARAAERAKVHRLQELHQAEQRSARLQEPLLVVVADLVTDTFRLARTLVSLPFRMASVLRGRREVPA